MNKVFNTHLTKEEADYLEKRFPGKGLEYAEKLRARGLKVYADSYDQADEQSILALRDRLVAKFGKVDILVNNSALRGCFKGGFNGGEIAVGGKDTLGKDARYLTAF